VATLQAPTVISYPDYSHRNAYQSLLYSNYKGVVTFGGVETAANSLANLDKGVLHINWINQVVTPSAEDTLVQISRFKEDIGILKNCGIKLAWTVHNLYGHSTPSELRGVERDFRKWLLQNVDVLILHKHSHLPIVASEYGAMPRRVYFHDHGLYEVEPLDLPASSEIASLVNESRPIIGLIGQIRPYKGLNDAIDILNRLSDDVASKAQVLIAGKIEWSFKAEVDQMVNALCERVRVTLIDKRLDDAELYTATRISRALLLPYRDILNSGSLRYNQTVGAPSLMPSRHENLFAAEPGVIFYHDHVHAAQILNEIVDQSREQFEALRESITAESKENLRWPDLTPLFAALV
jgi:glycosyltransferase involved in cell wall biosynthesis